MLTSLPSLLSVIPRSALILAIAGFGLGVGAIPEFSQDSLRFQLTPSAQAQTYTDDELRGFADAVLQIEKSRNEAYDQIKAIAGTVPDILCYQDGEDGTEPVTRDSLRQQLQTELAELSGSQLDEVVTISFNFCRSAQKTVYESGLSADVFNGITNNWQRLEGRLNRIFIEIQQEL